MDANQEDLEARDHGASFVRRQMTFVSDRTSVLFEPPPAPTGARKGEDEG
jgi:hypothetical protein